MSLKIVGRETGTLKMEGLVYKASKLRPYTTDSRAPLQGFLPEKSFDQICV